MSSPDKIKFRGATYVRVAQFQQLLGAYETKSRKLLALAEKLQFFKPGVENAHKAILKGKKVGNLQEAASMLGNMQEGSKEFYDEVTNLIRIVNDMIGHVGMGGG